MSRSVPRALRLPLRAVAVRNGLVHHVARTLHPPQSEMARVVHAFAFKCDERDFARLLLAHRTQLWLYRTHQAAASGDFVVVDRSSAAPSRRAWVIELKRGQEIRFGGSWQLRNTDAVIADLIRSGDLAPDAGYRPITGDRSAVLEWFGCRS